MTAIATTANKCEIVPGGAPDIHFLPKTHPWCIFLSDNEIEGADVPDEVNPATAEQVNSRIEALFKHLAKPVIPGAKTGMGEPRHAGTYSHLQAFLCLSAHVDMALEKVVKSWGRCLMHVNVKFAHHLTDKGLDAIDANCPRLTELTITGAMNISPARVYKLINNHSQASHFQASIKKLHCDHRQHALLKGHPQSTKTFAELQGPARCPGGHLHSDHNADGTIKQKPTEGAATLISAFSAPLGTAATAPAAANK
jgi:hypothetical protein